MRRVLCSFKIASAKDPVWWVQKEEIRFNYLAGIHWHGCVGHPVGILAFFLGPVAFKIGMNWGPKAAAAWPYACPPVQTTASSGEAVQNPPPPLEKK